MRLNKSKIVIILSVSLFLSVFWAQDALAQGQSLQASVSKDLSFVDLAVERICKGQYDAAAEILSNSKSQKANELRKIIEDIDALNKKRAAAKVEQYEEKLKELQEIKDKGEPKEPNDISDAFAAIVAVNEYATKEQKKALLDDDFVKKTVKNSLELSLEYQQKGDWVKAYTSSYIWLKALYKDNKEYKSQAEELTQKAIIQASLKDTLCETAADRFEGILPSMFIRTIQALDFGYVSPIDYTEMAQKAIDRCENLAEVLLYPDEKVAYKVSKDQVIAWNAAMREIKKNIGAKVGGLSKDDFLKIFNQVLFILPRTLKIPREILISEFAQASLETLDPYTNLVWPWNVKDFEKNMTQKFSGIGIEISNSSGELTVNSLMPDTPAYNSGLDAEDVIVEVDGEPTKDMSINCAVSKITGPSGTDVTLTIRSKGQDKTKKITITRATIDVPTVRGWQRKSDGKWKYMLDPKSGIGYLRITSFTDNSARLMKQAVASLEKQGLNGLILDLRNNPGGYLQTAANIVDMFVDKGPIVSTRPRWGFTEVHRAHKKATLKMPLVVLINGSSASASEIVSGALQDPLYKRATLIGSRSYGKGTVQQIVSVPGNGAKLKYTMAFYHLPSGQKVKNRYQFEKIGRTDWGITPDVEVKLTANELKTYYDTQKDNDVLVKANHDHTNGKVTRHNLEEVLEADPQLAMAVLVLKAKELGAN